MTSHRDAQPAGPPSRRRILRAGLAGAGGLGLVGGMRESARAQGAGTICIIWEIGELEFYDQSVWFYYAQDCQPPWGTYVYYSALRLDPELFGCGGPYCYPAPVYSTTSGSTNATRASATGANRRVLFLDQRLRRRGLVRPFPAGRRFRPGARGRVRVLEEGNYRVAPLQNPVHLALVLVTPPDDPTHQRHPVVVGIGATTNDPTAAPVQANVLRPRADEQYVMVYRASDDVFFHVITCGE